LSRRWPTTLLRKQAKAHVDHRDTSPSQPSRQSAGAVHRSFERRFEAVRSTYRGLLHLCLHNRLKVIEGFIGFTLLSFALAPYLGQDFFPSVDGGQIKIHVREQTGTRSRKLPSSLTGSAKRSTRSFRSTAERHRRQYRPQRQRHQHGVQQLRHDRVEEPDNPDHPQAEPRAAAD